VGGDLIVVSEQPFCAETPLERQEGLLTPIERFYARNNFPFPAGWPGLRVGGAVERPVQLSLADLRERPRRRLVATLECAGNGRAFLDPPVPGEPWRLGAVSTAEWEGVPLAEVLAPTGLRGGCVEVLFEAADGFARSLPLERALHPDTLLVLGMNGEPLPPAQGGPLRLLVPGWYGMAAVKWVTGVEALTEPFRGRFQVEKYVIDGRPVRETAVRALIVAPPADATLPRSPQRVRGLAWSGHGPIRAVELSEDGGSSWMPARLERHPHAYAWTWWEADWTPSREGPLSLLARASDQAGNEQPLHQAWNALGYANNAAVPHPLTVAARGR